MPTHRLHHLCASTLILMACAGTVSAETPANDAFQPAAFGAPVVTAHKGRFHGKDISYTATVAATEIKDAKGQAALSVVTFAYETAGKADSARPVIFAFNGGPISPSLYLHMGLLGPKRVEVPAPGQTTGDAQLVDNPDFPIDAADIVLIDPAGTGFSRPEGATDLKTYFTVEADAREFADVIEAWLRAHGREASPVYILGESYGTIRAPQIVKDLAEDPQPVKLGGLILLGEATNILEYAQRPGNIVSYAVSLPTLAATAWYHKAVDRRGLSLDAFVAQARTFANTTYLQALYDGDDLSPETLANVAQTLSDFTGISKDYYIAHRLRISKEAYRRALFADKTLILGQSDTRYLGPLDKGDPAQAIPHAYETAFQTYLKSELKVDKPLPYLSTPPNDSWNYGGSNSPFSDWPFYKLVSDALIKQPQMKIMVGTGYFDTQTTTGAAEYLVRQAGWPKANVRLTYYPAGHMSYSDPASATKLSDDLRAFIAENPKTSSPQP